MAHPVPGRTVTQLQQVTLAHNQAVQVITKGNKAVLCCKHEDLKNMSFRTHGSSYCCIPTCKNFRGKIPNLSFFQFPKDVERCKTWVSFTTREDLMKKGPALLPRSGFAICAAHFEGSMFMNPKSRNRLIHCAIPTIFDPSCPPPPASIKELATKFYDNPQDLVQSLPFNPQLVLEDGDLCVFHRKFLKTVTALETDICDVRFCMTCGSSIDVIKEVSPGTYYAICDKNHTTLFTTEFASKCREWVNNCNNLDQIKEEANIESKCHLCEEHFGELKDSSTSSVSNDDLQSNPGTSEHPFPSGGEVTVTTTPAPKIVKNMQAKNESVKQPKTYPSLPSCFFSLGGYATRLDASLSELNTMADVRPKFTQTDLTKKSLREFELCRKLKNSSSTVCRLKKRIKSQEEEMKKPPNVSLNMVSKELSKYLKGPCLRLVQEQLKVSGVAGRGVRWSDDILSLSKIIMRESGKAYSILRRLMLLPSRSTIQRHQMTNGVTPSLVNYLASTYPSGQNQSAEKPDLEDHSLIEFHMEEVDCTNEMSEGDISESEIEKKKMSGVSNGDSADELMVSSENENEPTEQQNVEDQVIQDETCVQLMSVEDMRIYEMYAQAAAGMQTDSGSILLNGSEGAVTIINVIPVKEEPII